MNKLSGIIDKKNVNYYKVAQELKKEAGIFQSAIKGVKSIFGGGGTQPIVNSTKSLVKTKPTFMQNMNSNVNTGLAWARKNKGLAGTIGVTGAAGIGAGGYAMGKSASHYKEAVNWKYPFRPLITSIKGTGKKLKDSMGNAVRRVKNYVNPKPNPIVAQRLAEKAVEPTGGIMKAIKENKLLRNSLIGTGVVGVGAGGYALYNRNKNKGNQEDPNNNYY